jgi:heptosyltransferase-1
MKVLLIKMSSMGDVIHALPALTDAAKHILDIQFDWVVEESFQEIPRWHPAVKRVIPIALRRWRKNWLKAFKSGAPQRFFKALRQEQYDVIIDAQGLLKSAIVARCAKGLRHGLDEHSARESKSAWFYERTHSVEYQQHAVLRVRKLFAQILGYPLPESPADYGIRHYFAPTPTLPRQSQGREYCPYLVFLHNTTWETKLYPELYWQRLGELANQQGFQVKLTSGNTTEKARADRIAATLKNAEALPRLSILEVANLLVNAAGVISVDTGFSHLAAALAVPNVALYGPTNPVYTGAYGTNQIIMAAQFPCAPCLRKHCNHPDRHQTIAPPCFRTLPPEKVWQALFSQQ